MAGKRIGDAFLSICLAGSRQELFLIHERRISNVRGRFLIVPQTNNKNKQMSKQTNEKNEISFTLKMPPKMFEELSRLSVLLDLNKSQIFRRSFREFCGLHQLQDEYGESVVIDPPKKVLDVPEGF
jgi:hypothetical protein